MAPLPKSLGVAIYPLGDEHYVCIKSVDDDTSQPPEEYVRIPCGKDTGKAIALREALRGLLELGSIADIRWL